MCVSLKLSVCAVLLMLFSTGLSQSDSRRAVSEHQLMHDRSRTVQSLKRLIWLSSAMEGLHTAQTRAVHLAMDPEMDPKLDPEMDPRDLSLDQTRDQTNLMKRLIQDFFKSTKV